MNVWITIIRVRDSLFHLADSTENSFILIYRLVGLEHFWRDLRMREVEALRVERKGWKERCDAFRWW